MNSGETLDLAAACSPEQLVLKKDSGWSIIQILEHICLADKIFMLVVSRPATTIHSTNELVGEQKIKERMMDQRHEQLAAPDSLKPKGKLTTLEDFENLFLTQRNQLKDQLLHGNIVIDNRVHKHLYLGEMTIHDWCQLIIYHTKRHLEQIKDVLAEKKAINF